MNFLGLIFLIITHYLSGRGTLYLFKIKLKPVATFCVSMITGVVIASLLPFLLQLFYIPITTASVVTIICASTILLNITSFKYYKLPAKIEWKKPAIELYEIPFLAILSLCMLVSIWRCFYFPPFARDILSGPEALAEYAVREKTLLNSIFTLNLESTNNHLKPPFVADLQIIYKLLVYPFGEVWLSLIACPFVILMYVTLKEKLHPIVGGILMLFFISMPDPFAYMYIVLFDYSNMACFFLGFYFLAKYAEDKQYNNFLFSTLMFGLATSIRSETLILVGMTVPLLWFYFWKEKLPLRKVAIRTVLFVFVSFFFYYIWIGVFVKHYMPVHFDVNTEINKNFSDLSPFFTRISDMNSKLIFGGLNTRLYGYFIYLFCIIMAADIVFFRKKFNTEGRVLLYGIAVVYIGLPLLGYLIPWVDLLNTTKRGLYKMFPLMLIYMRNSGLLAKLSEALNSWEMPQLPSKKSQPVLQPKAAATPGNKKQKKGK